MLWATQHSATFYAAVVLLSFLSCTQVPQDKNGSKQRGVSEQTSGEEETSTSANLDVGEKGSVETLSAKITIKAGSFKTPVKISLAEVSTPSAAKSFTSLSKAQNIKITTSSGGKVSEIALPLEVSLSDLSSSGKDLWILIIDGDGKKGLVLSPRVSGASVSFKISSTSFTAIAIESLADIPSDIDFTVDESGAKTDYTGTDTGTATPTPTAIAKVTLAAPASPSAAFGNTQITLSWTEVAGAKSYKIFYKTATGVASSDSFLTSTTNSKIHTGLTNGTTYYYKVAAIDSAGNLGTLSAEFSAMPAGPAHHFIFSTSNTYPTTVSAGANFAASNTIAAQLVDAAGFPSHDATVTAYLLAFTDNTCSTLAVGNKGGTWSGSLTSATKNFTSFNYEKAESIYLGVCDTSNCSGGTLTKACRSTAVTVSPAGAASLSFSTLPSVTAGTSFTLTVELLDAYGNRDTNDSSTQITVAACSTSASDANCTAGTSTLSGTLTQTASGGLATFTGLTYATAEGVKFRATTAGGLQKASSSSTVAEVTKVYGGRNAAFACAVINGGVKCWGDNSNAVLGNGASAPQTKPMGVTGLSSGVSELFVGTYNACALLNTGGIKCWGTNGSGELGNNSTSQPNQAVQVSGLTSGVTSVAFGGGHLCAIVNGGAKCWGDNSYGQLGDNTTTQRLTPVDVQGLSSGVTAIAAGWRFTCAIHNGAVKCWGYNQYGKLGVAGSDSSVPVTAVASGATAIVAVDSTACAIVNGGMKCWGLNDRGQLGDGTSTNRSTPVDAIGLTSGVTKIYLPDTETSCAVLDTGAAKCAGYNLGRLGDGGTSQSSTPVTTFASGVASLAMSAHPRCALMTTGGVKCWGEYVGNGQIGDGSLTGTPRASPSQVIGLTSGVTQLTTGTGFGCVVVGGEIKCWGTGSGLDPVAPDNWSTPQPVDFTCPKNYVLVPAYSDSDITVPAFCVMKYEAKDVSGVATSVYAPAPWVNIARGASSSTASSAWKACKDLGSGYDLISNAQWQSIARQLEDATHPALTAPNNYRNWSNSSKSSTNFMNRGHSDGNMGATQASSTDDGWQDQCYDTNNSNCMNKAHSDFSQKRTHVFSNGRMIWDFAGNVYEWVKDDSSFIYGGDAYLNVIGASYGNTCATGSGCNGPQGKPKAVFGPVGDYSSHSAQGAGLGYAYLNYNNGTIARGGNSDSAGNPGSPITGIFAVYNLENASTTRSYIGFRCVYVP